MPCVEYKVTFPAFLSITLEAENEKEAYDLAIQELIACIANIRRENVKIEKVKP